MAKKVTIEGSDKLHSLSDPWGGIGDGVNPVYNISIPDGTEWGMNRGEVERFIKAKLLEAEGKVGGIAISREIDENNYYHLLGFDTSAHAQAYSISGVETGKVFEVVIPISTVQSDSYRASLTINRIGSSAGHPFLFQFGEEWSIGVRLNAWHLVAADNTREPLPASTRLLVERSNDGVNWYQLTSAPITSIGEEVSFPTSVDIGSVIGFGEGQEMRIRLSTEPFSYNDNGVEKLLSAQPVVIYVKPIDLSVSMDDSQWLQAKEISGPHLTNLRFKLLGNVTKELHVKVSNSMGTFTYENTYSELSLVGDYTITAYDTAGTAGVATTGVHKIEAWLTCTSVDGSTLTSKKVRYEIMVVNTDNTQGAMEKRILIQNMAESVDNFVQSEICRYMIWNPIVQDGHIVNDTESNVMVHFIVASKETLTGSYSEYLLLPVSQRAGYSASLIATLEVEDNASADSYNAYLHALDENDNPLMDSEFLSIDNTGGFQPVAGSVFRLNPKVRNNDESQAQTIINAVNSQVVASQWDGFQMDGGKMDSSNGYITDESGEKVLRISAGRKLTISYNPFSYFYENPNASKAMTMDFDFCVRNITNEIDPIIKLAEYQAGIDTWLGLLMKPLDGTMISVKSQSNVEETDFRWAEGRRLHLSISVVPNIKPYTGDLLYNSRDESKINDTIDIVRVYINGVIVREIFYNAENRSEFCTGSMSNGGIVIGQTGTNGRESGADIDLYGIRVWHEGFRPDKVLQNYIATIPSGEVKRRVKAQNDILQDNNTGKLSLAKVKNTGKNVMIWHGIDGKMPLIDDDNKYGWFEIYRYDNEGNYLPQYSGTFCKTSKSLKATGQGTTAKSYYYWNIQVKLGDVTDTITLTPSQIHSDIVLGTPEQDGGGNWSVPIYGGCLGKNFPVQNKTKSYPCSVENGEIVSVTLPDGWIDGNGLYRGMCWQSGPNIPFAQKLVLKVNYASSMQSHLIGANWLFNDLHTRICGENSLQSGSPAGQTAVVAKHVEPMLFFTTRSDVVDEQQTEQMAVYQGPAGMGAGKMDKPTWGYVKSLHPLFAMFEGAINNSLLTDMLAPFDDVDHVLSNGTTQPAKVKYWLHDPVSSANKDPECFYYRMRKRVDDGNGNISIQDEWEKGIELDGGATGRTVVDNPTTEADRINNLMCRTTSCDDPDEAPSVAITTKLRNAWNYIYLHNPNIRLYEGTFEDFLLTAGSLDDNDKRRKWVCISNGSNANNYLLKRYDFCEMDWVDAGLWNENTHSYNTIDIRTGIDMNDPNMRDASKVVAKYKELLIADAYPTQQNAGIGQYFKVSSLLFHYAFVNMFIAGTDNCSKNTYYVIDPETGLFELHQDDVDTILATDNFGYQTKPYYIDRVHPYPEGSDRSGYDGMRNGLFDLVEAMWMEDDSHTIVNTMAQVVSEIGKLTGGLTSAESDAMGSSVWKSLNKYLFDIQRWIPQVAYNEAARIRYEFPAALGYTGREGLARPLAQSMGDQLEAEIQFMKRRLIYMASFAGCCEFGASIGQARVSSGISDLDSLYPVRIKALPNGGTPAITFRLVPHQYMYPCCYQNETTKNSYTRVPAGQEFVFNVPNPRVDNDYSLVLPAINYYRHIGNVGNMSTGSFNLIGTRLLSFIAEPSLYYPESGNPITAEQYNALADKSGYQPAFQPVVVGVPNKDEATRLLELSFKGVSTIASTEAMPFNMSKLTYVQKIDLSGTKFGRVILPKTVTLTKLALPATLTSLVIEGQPNIANTSVDANASFSIEGISNMTSITVKGNTYVNGVFRDVLDYGFKHGGLPNLQSITFRDVDWTVDTTFLRGLLAITNVDITGTIRVNGVVNLALATQVLDKFPNVFDAGSQLTIIYTNETPINDAEIILNINGVNPYYIDKTGQYQFSLNLDPIDGNDLRAITWGIDTSQASGEASINGKGLLTVTSLNEVDAETGIVDTNPITISVRITTASKVIEKTFETHLYYREAELGDYVYYDGTWSDVLNPFKSVIGICFCNEVVDGFRYRLMVGLKNLSYTTRTGTLTSLLAWGLSPNNIGGVTPVDNDDYYQPSNKVSGYIRYVYDVPTTNNETVLSVSKTIELLKQAWIYGDFYGFKDGDVLPMGQIETLKIIRHRNLLLNDSAFASLTPSIPTAHDDVSEFSDLELQMAVFTNKAIEAGLTSSSSYYLFYYPAISFCFAYEPPVKGGEVLADKFKAHNWWLPSQREIIRIGYYAFKGYTVGTEDAIFAKAKTEGILTSFTMFASNSGQYRCTAEYSLNAIGSLQSSYCLRIGSSEVYMGYSGYNGVDKGSGFYVRPVCKF